MAQAIFKIRVADKARFDAGKVCFSYPTEAAGVDYLMLSEESTKVVFEPWPRGGYTVRLRNG